MTHTLMTDKELQEEITKGVQGYHDYCITEGRPPEQIAHRVAYFEKMLRMCVNEFHDAREHKAIKGEVLDWAPFYAGFITGIQHGQQMTAESPGIQDKINEATGR